MTVDEIQVRKQYKVTISDCCVTAEFTASPMTIRKEDGEIRYVLFDNGVEMTYFLEVGFELIG